jgi:cytochrome c oxidase assembly protein Cox11
MPYETMLDQLPFYLYSYITSKNKHEYLLLIKKKKKKKKKKKLAKLLDRVHKCMFSTLNLYVVGLYVLICLNTIYHNGYIPTHNRKYNLDSNNNYRDHLMD